MSEKLWLLSKQYWKRRNHENRIAKERQPSTKIWLFYGCTGGRYFLPHSEFEIMAAGYTFYIKRLLSLPPHTSAKKILAFVRTVINSKIEKVKVRTFSQDVNDTEFSAALKNEYNVLGEFTKRPNIFLPPYETDVKHFFEKDADSARAIIYHADRICAHKFDLLGSGEVFLGDKIDWHTDFKVGYKWGPKKFYKDVEIPYGKADIKVPWELSRFQHLTILGQAYRLSNDEKYAAEFVGQITDWIKKNPVKLGPNWVCTMDVAIRAANWLVGWEFFKGSRSISEDFVLVFLKSLLSHGRFIRSHLEYSGSLTSNHYLSDIAGLFFIAAMVPEFKESEEWLSFSKRELETEMKKQVYGDGCDFEASTCYHRLVLELFFYPALLGKRKGTEFSSEYNSRLKNMFEALVYLMKPNGRMPQIGDNDSGRFVKFELPDTEVLDMRYLLPLAALYFNDAQFKILWTREENSDMPDYVFSALWVFGADASREWRDMPSRNAYELKSRAFRYTGWYVMREEGAYMLISNGPNGQDGNGGHAHNDKLSFELSVNGSDVIVDPGSFAYTADPISRNKFRSTISHNTTMLDDKEQNEFYGDLLFFLPDNTKATCKKWHKNDSGIIFEGAHYGYQRLKNRVVHERLIAYSKKEREFVFEDRLSGTGTAELKLFLHFAPGLLPHCFSGTEIRVRNDIVNVAIEFPNILTVFIDDYLYSPSYGMVQKAKRVVLYNKVTLPCNLKWKIDLNVE
jgi:uncharacterized heparinase superfamily protein